MIESRVEDPLFRLALFRIRAFTFGSIASLFSSLGRGGQMFMLIIWLQGIWLPLHGYSFVETPLWAGIYMLPLTVGFLVMESGLLAQGVPAGAAHRISQLPPVGLLFASFLGYNPIRSSSGRTSSSTSDPRTRRR